MNVLARADQKDSDMDRMNAACSVYEQQSATNTVHWMTDGATLYATTHAKDVTMVVSLVDIVAQRGKGWIGGDGR